MTALSLSRHSSWETCSEQEETSLPAVPNADATLRRMRFVFCFYSNPVDLKLNPFFFRRFDSLGRNPIRSRKSFKDRPTSVYSAKSSSSAEGNPSSLPVLSRELPDAGFYYDLDGNIQSDDNDKCVAFDSCGNIPAVSKNEVTLQDLAAAIVDHSFA